MTPSPKAPIELDISPAKTFPTRDDQLNMKAFKASEKQDKNQQLGEACNEGWTAEQEAEMWADYYVWCLERREDETTRPEAGFGACT